MPNDEEKEILEQMKRDAEKDPADVKEVSVAHAGDGANLEYDEDGKLQ